MRIGRNAAFPISGAILSNSTHVSEVRFLYDDVQGLLDERLAVARNDHTGTLTIRQGSLASLIV